MKLDLRRLVCVLGGGRDHSPHQQPPLPSADITFPDGLLNHYLDCFKLRHRLSFLLEMCTTRCKMKEKKKTRCNHTIHQIWPKPIGTLDATVSVF